MWFPFLVLGLGGVALIVVGWLGLTGKLPPNAVAGIRTPYSMSTPERWYAVHRAGSPIMIFVGVAIVAGCAAFLPFLIMGKISDGLAGAVLISLAVLTFVAALMSWWIGTSAAKRQLD